MVFIVEFADGRATQIVANIALDARMTAIKKFKDRQVVRVRPAGLREMLSKVTPDKPQKIFN